MDLNEKKLLEMVVKMQPIEFVGLAKLLGAQLIQEKEDNKLEAKPFSDVLEDVLARFQKLNRQRKREILKLIKNSNKMHRSDEHASNPENTESSDNN